MRAAVLYLRSSKDRAAVSIATQRQALLDLAKSKNLTVLAEYVDAVESGKDEDRPAYQRMLGDLGRRGRAWSHILAYDTSRIARRRFIAQALGHEAAKVGVSILYARVPEVDPITTVILESVLQAMDEVHSLMSREKGLAGMAENVRRGFRAGGRAPIGYKLEAVATGVVREGQPVTKSRLVVDPAAPPIAAYLRGRAAGKHGSALARELGLAITRSALVDVEWNALTYAGHTVWNMRGDGGRRRPRAQWQVQHGTHEALITEDEAEAILARREAPRPTRMRDAGYLLAGLVRTPAGKPWHGSNGRYATARGSIAAPDLEEAVLDHLARDFSPPALLDAIAACCREMQEGLQDRGELEASRAALGDIEKRLARITRLLAETSAQRPLLAQLETLEKERQGAAERVLRAEDAYEQVRQLEAVREEDLRPLAATLGEGLREMDRDALREILVDMVDRIEIDPNTRQGRLFYRVSTDSVASPRGHDAINEIIVPGPWMRVARRTPGPRPTASR